MLDSDAALDSDALLTRLGRGPLLDSDALLDFDAVLTRLDTVILVPDRPSTRLSVPRAENTVEG